MSFVCLGERRCCKEQSLSKQRGIGKETEVNTDQKDTGFNSQYLFIAQYNCLHHVTSIL